MAQAVINLSYVGQGPTGSGQVIADQTSGPKSKTLFAYGTLVASSGTYCTETSATVNFVDGTSTLAKVPVFVDCFVAGNSADSAGADAAINASVMSAVNVGAGGFTLSHASLVTTAASVTLGFIIAFSS